jgi:hypothetical protein
MVTNEARWILANTNIDPKHVADVWGIDEKECWCYLEDLNRVLNEAEKSYDPIAVQKQAREWKETIPDKHNIRIEAIKDQLLDAKIHPKRHDVDKLLFEVKVLRGLADRPTPEMIERAKAFPIAHMLNQTKRGNVSCPLHKDTNPSLQIKSNNTFTCYSCGEYGDAIHLYRLIHNVDFVSAVKALQ